MSKRHDLLSLLCDLYETVPKIVTVCKDCQIDVSTINLNLATREVWSNVLTEVKKRQKSQHIIDLIIKQYPNSKEKIELLFRFKNQEIKLQSTFEDQEIEEENTPTPLFKILGSPIAKFKPVNLFDCNRKTAFDNYRSELTDSRKMIIHLWGEIKHQPINFSRRIFYTHVKKADFDLIGYEEECITDLKDDARFCVIRYDEFNNDKAFVNDFKAKIKSRIDVSLHTGESGKLKKDFLSVAILYDFTVLEDNIERFKGLNQLLSEHIISEFDFPIHIFFCFDGIGKLDYQKHSTISQKLSEILNEEEISLIKFSDGVSWEDIYKWFDKMNSRILENDIVEAMIHFGFDKDKIADWQADRIKLEQKEVESFQYELYEEWQITNRIN